MVIVKILILAGTGQSFKYFHAEVINVIDVLGGLEQLPVLGWVGAGILEYLFGLIHESFRGHVSDSIQ